MQFRKDINGLRAIAVVFVVLFHFFPHYFSGGFVGVDIFFVISGYLMTKIICGKLDNENFSLIQFYLARVRRIFPALLLLLLVILIFGWFYFSPPDFRTFGKQFASSATLVLFLGIIGCCILGRFQLSGNFIFFTQLHLCCFIKLLMV